MKNFVIAGLLLACVVLLTILFWPKAYDPVKEDDKIAPAAKEAVAADVKDINNKINNDGFATTVGKDKDHLVKNLNQLDDSSKYWFDKYTEQLGINKANADLLVSANATIKGLALKASKSDTGFFYSDKYARIEFVKGKDSLSTGHFNFTYNADINYAEYSKRDWFLGKKKKYFEFWIADSRATVNGMKRIRVEAREPAIKVDVNASSFYTDRLNIGADAGIHFGRARLGGGYYFDMLSGKWRPLVSVKYKLIDF